MDTVNISEYSMLDGTGYEPGGFSYTLPTEDDLPYDDGDVMETERHKEQMNLLIDSLRAFWKGSRQYYAGGNMFIHFEMNSMRHFKGPDFFLVMNADRRERKSWVVWQENMRFPDLIIELLSDSTRETDKKEKKKLYSQVFGTPEYYIYDPFSYEFRGYALSGRSYKTVKPDRDRKIYSRTAELYLAVRNERLRWMTEDGYILPSHEEQAESERKRAEYAESRLDSERLRAEQAEHRAAMLADKLRQLGISVE